MKHKMNIPIGSLLVTVALVATYAMPARAATAQTYIVLYKTQAVSTDASSAIASAGGTLAYSYPQIGVVIAKSANALFASQLLANGQGVQAVAATSGLGVGLSDNVVTNDADTTVTVNAPAPGSDTLSGLQWDMDQIHAPAARHLGWQSVGHRGRH